MKIIPLLLALGLAVGGSLAPTATLPIEDGSVSIVAAPAFSGALQPGQPLLVSGTITNSAEQTMDGGTATIYLGTSRLTTRAALSKWLSPDDSSGASSGTQISTFAVGELAAGQVRYFSITVPASEILLPSDQNGVYPVTARLASGTVQIDLAHSAIVWNADRAGQGVNLIVVAPLDAPPSTTGILSAADLETLTAQGGLLDTQLTTAREHDLALGVDPMIVASIRLLGTSAPATARDWLARLESSPSGLFVLPYADADLALQRRAGVPAPLAPTSFAIDESLFPVTPDETPTPSGSPTPAGISPIPTPESLVRLAGAIDGLAWPSDTGITDKDLDFISAGGYTRTLTTSANIAGSMGTSPNVTVGEHRVTVSDSAISAVLRTAAKASTDAEWSHAMASLSGLLSVTASEHPGATVVATLGRDGAATGLAINRTLNAVDSLSFVKPTTLSAAIAVTAAPVKLADLDDDTGRASIAKALLASEDDTIRFATVADDPSLVTGPQRLALLALLSNSWEGDTAGWANATDGYLADNTTLRSSVRIPESSQITFPLDKGNLPIAVRNELGFPVTVYVTVQPERAILDVLNNRVELKIEANSQAKVLVPVQSIANGEVRTMLTLTSASNQPISTPTYVVVNVQAGWETAATVVLAIIVVLLFSAGVWRTVLRRRKARIRRTEEAEPTS